MHSDPPDMPEPSAPAEPIAPDLTALPSAAKAMKQQRRRRGKIARLPRKIREEVNVMISDGLPYAEIIARLGDHGKGLNKDNLINWHAGGYRDWLRDQPWLDQLHASLDFATIVLDDSDAPKIREASLIIAVKQMYELIKSFEPAEFKQQLKDEPATYSKILNSLSKLAEVGLRYDRERGDAIRRASRDTNRAKKAAGLTDDMLRQYENEFNLLRRPSKTSHGLPTPAAARLSEVNAPATTQSGELTKDQETSSEVKRG